MNLTTIEVYPSGALDRYDRAHQSLIQSIMMKEGIEAVTAGQEKLLTIRNEIAKKLHEHSWCNVPEEDRH